jgi:hypothetical protein
MGFGLKEVRETVSGTAEKLAATARDTRSAIYGVAAIAITALVVAVIALVLVAKGRKAKLA